ncbi:MAG: hypothetical protein NWE88_09535 [Candidatus Bathyarchaeota archaeon]|nr:hypothetical protein [Candidatus Bathyarchaeota archaeon]
MENKQITEEMLGATDIAGSDSTNNPFDDIVGAYTTIKGNGYPVNYIPPVSPLFGE